MPGMDPMFTVAEICERTGWTWDQYWEQPDSFLQVMTIKMGVEARIRREQAPASS